MIGIVFWIATSLASFAAPKPLDCPSLLTSTPNQFAVGVLSETFDGKLVLGLGNNFGPGHSGLINRIHDRYGPNVDHLWAGELEIEQGRILRANEVSGTFARRRMTQNKVEVLEEILRCYRPTFLSTNFEPTPEQRLKHLDPVFAQFKNKLMSFSSVTGTAFQMRHESVGVVVRAILSIDLLIHTPRNGLTKSLTDSTIKTISFVPEIIQFLEQRGIKIIEDVARLHPHQLNPLLRNFWQNTSQLKEVRSNFVLLKEELLKITDPDCTNYGDFILITE